MTRKTAKRNALAETSRAKAEIQQHESFRDTITLAPNEKADDVETLRASLVGELRPNSTLAQLIVRDLVEIELERRRLASNLQTAINAHAKRLMVSAIGRADPGRHPKEAEQLARDWAHGPREARTRAQTELTEMGILLDVISAEARIDLGDTLAPHVQERARIEERRRRLLDDFHREARRAGAPVEEAETRDDE